MPPLFLALKLGPKRCRWKCHTRLFEYCGIKTGKNVVRRRNNSKKLKKSLLNFILLILPILKDKALNEKDELFILKYTSTRQQGAGALFTSYIKQLPIRVFRSSKLDGQYSPPPREGGKTAYRYDGLYSIKEVQDSGGKMTKVAPKAGDQYTFTLLRISKNSSNLFNLFMNNIDTDELLNRIYEQKSVVKYANKHEPCEGANTNRHNLD